MWYICINHIWIVTIFIRLTEIPIREKNESIAASS